LTALTAATLAWAGLAAPHSLAARPALSCGAVLVAATTLTRDLTNCPNNGIVVGANDVTLDLNGHTIGGDGIPVPSCPDGASCDVGIDNSAGHVGVTIRGGSVHGFDVGVLVLGASASHIQRISTSNDTSVGVIVGDSVRSSIDHNSSMHDGLSGILIYGSHDVRVAHNSVSAAHGYAIPVFGSSHNRFEQNVLNGNDHGILLDSSNDNAVTGNRIFHSGGSSIDVGPASGNRVVQNVLIDNGDGVVLTEARNNQISDNTVLGTGSFGFPDTGGFGVILDGAADNLVQRNKVTGGRGPAIFITSLDSPETSDRNVVSNNVANSRVYDGILVNANATGTLVEGNTANRNGGDGIHVDAAATTVTRNTADHNHDLGIDAVPGVIDGGGNRANANGNPLQCLNITCHRSSVGAGGGTAG